MGIYPKLKPLYTAFLNSVKRSWYKTGIQFCFMWPNLQMHTLSMIQMNDRTNSRKNFQLQQKTMIKVSGSITAME